MANSEQHSGLRTAAELARKAKALANIARALAVTGLKGAAAATVKESIPFMIKAVLGVIIFILVLSTVVFTALPNIFFGFDNSYSADVDDMTVKASSIGSAYVKVHTGSASLVLTVKGNRVLNEEYGSDIPYTALSYRESDIDRYVRTAKIMLTAYHSGINVFTTGTEELSAGSAMFLYRQRMKLAGRI